jgi:putative MATE family efflux protein
MSELPPADPAPLRGDLTQGPILKTLIAFAMPMLIGNVIQTANGAVNAVWIGRLLGENALAATTNANGIMFVLYSLVFGFGTAASVRIGQHYGARNLAAAREAFGGGIGFSLAVASLVAALSWMLTPWLLHVLATPEPSKPLAATYLGVLFLSLPLAALNMVLSMGLRAAGEARAPLWAMVITVALDVVLNPLLILGAGPLPGLGIAGSALASVIAGAGGIAYQLRVLYRRDLPLRLRGRELQALIPRRGELGYMLAKGMPTGAQMLLGSSAMLVMIGLVNREGIHTTAAYGAAMQLWNFLQMPSFALGMAVSAMVAQSIGAGKHERVGQVTTMGMWCNLAMTGVVALLMTVFARPLLALFLGSESAALGIAVHIQTVVTWSYVVIGASMVYGGTMRAYGVVWVPLLVHNLALYPVRLGFYFAAYPALGSEALWWSFPLASGVSALLTWWVYAHGGWRAEREKAYKAG